MRTETMQKYPILFVDDDEHLLLAMKRSLSRSFRVEIASTVVEALKMVREETFAMVVSDYKMPKLTGIDFLMQVKSISPETTRVMLSGHADMAVALDALNKGSVFRFLEKPVSSSDLELVAQQAIDEHVSYVETQNRILFDSLTDSFNRKTIMEHLSLEVERCRRYGRALSIAILDIDFFKKVNDTYGHPAGDFVLQEIVRIIRENIRSVDLVGRYGGEEFLLLFPETPLSQAVLACEKLRLCLHTLRFDEFPALTVTASFGVAGYTGTESEDQLVKLVDRRLYSGKCAGRDIVISSDQNSTDLTD